MDFCQYILIELIMYFHIFFIVLHWQIYSQIIQARKVEDVELAYRVLEGQNGHPYFLPASKHETFA